MILDKEAAAAAKWWADELRRGAKLDNGDALSNAMGGVFRTPAQPPEKIDLFEKALTRIIAERFEKSASEAVAEGNPLWGRALRVVAVDYGPCKELADAAEEAGMTHYRTTTFPWKTVMWISPGEVTVSHGYGAKAVTIYSTASQQEEPAA